MTREEFSSGFDVLLDSYSKISSFGTNNGDIRLNEHEKSVFLTQAQEEETLSLYTGKNVAGEGFEKTEEVRRYLSTLIKEAELSAIETTNGKPLGMESNSKFFTLPEDLMFITYESVEISDGKCDDMTNLDVIPVRQDEYHKIKRNPFRGANDRRALRLDLSDGVIEIVAKFNVTSYYLRYLRKLRPIVLVNLGDEQSIEGVSTVSECELPEMLHQRILDRAVMLALQSRGYAKENNNRE